MRMTKTSATNRCKHHLTYEDPACTRTLLVGMCTLLDLQQKTSKTGKDGNAKEALTQQQTASILQQRTNTNKLCSTMSGWKQNAMEISLLLS